jgi:hypothetical protein
LFSRTQTDAHFVSNSPPSAAAASFRAQKNFLLTLQAQERNELERFAFYSVKVLIMQFLARSLLSLLRFRNISLYCCRSSLRIIFASDSIVSGRRGEFDNFLHTPKKSMAEAGGKKSFASSSGKKVG